MKRIEKVFTGILLLMCLPIFAQEENNEERIPMEVLERSLKISQEAPPPKIQNQWNEVFIQQVGNGNIAVSRVVSERSDIQLRQHGDYNFVGILANVKSMDAELEQHGNGNKKFVFVMDPSAEPSINVTQNGDYGRFESYGSNDIGNKLKFETNGDFKTIIVRNYN